MTYRYNVFSGTLNPTHSINALLNLERIARLLTA